MADDQGTMKQRHPNSKRLLLTLFTLGVLVLAICFLYAIGSGQKAQRRILFQHNDLFAALVYYAEDHCGQLPESLDALLTLPNLQRNADGSLVVLDRESANSGKVYGVRIEPGWQDRIVWGADLALANADSKQTETAVLRPLEDSALARTLAERGSRQLIDICMELRETCGEGTR